VFVAVLALLAGMGGCTVLAVGGALSWLLGH
jgi:hypothetical protein